MKLLVFVPILLIGCGKLPVEVNETAETIVANTPSSFRFFAPENLVRRGSRLLIDGGVVFANQRTEFNYPLELLGLGSFEEPLTLSSSCDCIVPTVVEYRTTTGSVKKAIRLQYRGRNIENLESQSRSVLLGVEIVLSSVHGVEVTLLFQFLESVPVDS
jgi:hypothetical protein